MGIVAQGQVEIKWPQSSAVPLRGWYNVYADGDYSAAINNAPIPAWPDGEGWRGFGSGLFGAGRFGFGDRGLLFGQGRFGMGRFGFGALMLSFVTPSLADGTRTFNIVGFDEAGNPSAPSGGKEVSATISGEPDPPGVPTADSYVLGTDTLTISFALSDDDES